MLNPVTLPPGFAKLATSPLPRGSDIDAMTTGIALFASVTILMASVLLETMTSTLSRISSATRLGSRSSFPSANRHSKKIFCPST
jgi:hypothetical protein